MKRNKTFTFLLLLTIFLMIFSTFSGAKETPPRNFTGPNVVGEAFGRPVTNEELFYHYKTAS